MSSTGWKLTSTPLGVTLESRTVATGDPANLFLTGDNITLNSASGTIINGNLTVNGTTTTVDSENVSVKDPLIALARDNESNTLDIGFYGQYTSSGTKYTGLFFDATDSKFKLFKELTSEPTTTVDTSHPSFTSASLVANIEGTVSSLSNFTTDNLTEGSSNFYYADSKARSAISVAGNAIAYDSTSGEITVNLANTALPMFSAYKQNYASAGSSTDLVRFSSEDITIDTIDGWSLVTHLFTTNQDGKFRISFSFTPGEFSPDISLILYRNGTETTRKVSNYVSGGNVRGTVAMDIIEELTTGTSLGVRITIDRISYPTLEVTLENVSFVVQMLPENYFFPTSGVSESPVVSVNGQSGVVILNTSNIPEGSQAYFTTERARAVISAGEGIIYDENTGVITSDASSQWKNNVDDIYYNDGNVGIGTSEPEGKLHVVGDIVQNNVAIGHGLATVTDNSGTAIDTSKQFNFVEGALEGTGGRGIWATKIDGSGNETGNGVATDSSGNVYVIGTYTSNPVTIFNSDGSPSGITLSNAGSTAVCIIKYNNLGVAQWATRIDGSGSDNGRGIATDASGNVYVTGDYTGTVTIYSTGDVSFGTLSNAGGSAVFVAKYNTSGVAQWAARIDGSGSENKSSITVDSTGNVIVSGTYSSNPVTIFNSDGNSSGITLARTGSFSTFLVKYNNSGIAQWATRITNTLSSDDINVKTDLSGNIYLMTSVNFFDGVGSDVFNSDGTLYSSFLPLSETYDFILTKFDEVGMVTWISRIDSVQFRVPGLNKIEVDSTGNLIIYFQLKSTPLHVFNSDGSLYKTLTSSATIVPNNAIDSYSYVIKYNSDGFVQWDIVLRLIGPLEITTTGSAEICVDSADNIYITGTLVGSVEFNNSDTSYFGDLSDFTQTKTSSNFVAKYDKNGFVRWVSGMSAAGYVIRSSFPCIATDSNNDVYILGSINAGTVAISNSDKTSFGTLTFTGSGMGLVKFTGDGAIYKPYTLDPIADEPENQGRIIAVANKGDIPVDLIVRDDSENILNIRQLRKTTKFVFFGGKWYDY
jgi:hypothetical protein